jgi:predicted ATPase
MGIHTGEALVRGNDYVGHEVHRAKRISDAGHGGQILVSQTTADLVQPNASLIDLGPHRLKDLGEPQRLYQVSADGLERDFPKLRSLDAFTHSLPLQRSAFIGREREIAEIRALVETNRIVTLTGVGGCGKTRLALQAGAEELERFTDGVFFVNLAPISDPELVEREIAGSVDAPVGGAMPGLAGGDVRPIDEILLGYLASRACLLVLDNCEHLIDASADIADRILARCPQVSILATSREGLRLEGEQSWTVPSLSVPSEGTDAQDSESVSLFKSRAKAVRPGFDLTPENIEAVVEICRRLDGIPLAIEFAAARVTHLSPRQIAERLDDRFRLLTGGQRRVQRQQTLQAALDWSFELLDEDERVLLRRLSVFAGDFGIEAAEGICADEPLDISRVTDLLGSLVSKSLVDTELKDQEVRYKLLETVRAYAAEQLAHAQEAERLRVRHRDWYLEWLCSVPWDETFASLPFALRTWREEANLGAAIEWSVAEDRPDLVARMTRRWATGWGGTGPTRSVVRRWISFALTNVERLDPDDLVWCIAMATMPIEGMAEALAAADRAVEAAAAASAGMASWAHTYRGLATGVVAAMTVNDELAERCYSDFDEATRRAGTHLSWRMWAVFNRAMIDLSLARIADAEVTLDEAMQLAREAGNDYVASGVALYTGLVAHIMGDDEKAVAAGITATAVLDRIVGHRLDTGESLERYPLGFAAPGVVIGRAVLGSDGVWNFLRAYRPLALRSGMPAVEADLILACALLWYFDGDLHRASMLLSWVRARTIGAGTVPTPGDYVLYLHYRDLLRAALGPEEARRARDEGERLTLDEALGLAFADRVEA